MAFLKYNVAVGVLCSLALVATSCGKSDHGAPSDGSSPHGTAASKDSEIVLFQKRLADSRELLVVRSPRHPMAQSAPPVTPNLDEDEKRGGVGPIGCYVVSIQVVQEKAAPFTLASKVFLEPSDAPASGGISVLDVLMDDGIVTVAVGTDDIEFWRVNPFDGPWQRAKREANRKNALPESCTTRLSFQFTSLQAARYWDKTNVRVTLKMTQDGLVEADILAELATSFVQVPGKWEFRKASEKRADSDAR